MEQLLTSQFWLGLGTIIWVNIILSGDNAVVIALAARSLPERQQRQAIFWGAGAAVILRVALTIVAVKLLEFPYLKLVGGAALLWIAAQLLIPEKSGGDEVKSSSHLVGAVKTILVADLIMSTDNVIAVAAAAKGSVLLLVLGLIISIPLVVFGATMLMKLMERYPIIITLGAAILGWTAGEMAVTDPAVTGWIRANTDWLESFRVASILSVVAVLGLGKWLASRKRSEEKADEV